MPLLHPMTKHKITPTVELSVSGTKADYKIKPHYWLESIRILGGKGKDNHHTHVKPGFLKRLIKGETK